MQKSQKHQYGNVTDDGKIDPISEQNAYDQLSPAVRAAIREFPIEFSAEKTLEYKKLYRMNDAQLIKMIKHSEAEVKNAIREEYATMPVLLTPQHFIGAAARLPRPKRI